MRNIIELEFQTSREFFESQTLDVIGIYLDDIEGYLSGLEAAAHTIAERAGIQLVGSRYPVILWELADRIAFG